MRIHPAEIGFDFDGVIADTVEAFLRIACEEHGHCGIRPEDITHFMVEECLEMDASVAESIFLQILQDSLASGLKPMPGSVEVLSELALAAGVTIITARPKPEPVRQWLDATFSASVRPHIRVVAMGDHDDKARHIRMAGLSTFVDDRAETCLQLHRAGINPIVFHQPWNRNRHRLPLVRDWTEIRALCL